MEGKNENAKYWLKVLTEIRNRGVQNILITSVDRLSGFSEAIKSVFPHTKIQKCVVHKIRNTINHASSKHRKEFARDLKLVYTAPTEKAALIQLDTLVEKQGKYYAISLRKLGRVIYVL